MQKNVFGTELEECSKKPLTGYYRDGCCNTDANDVGSHTVCIIASDEFLDFSRKMGNDLSTPKLNWGFAGVKPGDRWCLCASRWQEAFDAGVAPLVVLQATNEKCLEILSLDDLLKHAYKEIRLK